MSSTFFNFFFCDIYRILIIIVLIIAVILDSCVLKLGLKSSEDFSLIFIGMLNLMLSSFFGGFGYLFNWVDDIEHGHLLFGDGDGFLCQLQSVTIGYFQEVRETFLALITILTFLKVKNLFIPRTNTSLLLLLSIGYFLPLFVTTVVAGNGAYGKSHLFCFTKEEEVGIKWGFWHFAYVCIDLGISLVLSLLLLVHFCKIRCQLKKENESKEESDLFSWCTIYKKILLFPSVQIIFFSIIFSYRILDWVILSDEKKSDEFYAPIAGLVSVVNTLPAFVYTIIFSYNNRMFSMHFEKEEEEDDNGIIQEITKISSGSD